MSEITVFENARVFDGRDTAESMHVLVEGNRIREVADRPITATDADVIDCAGRTLMPGMIDCHVHVYISSLRGSAKSALPTYYSHYASKFLTNILGCGFTTVRDIAGGDHGLAYALDSGFIEGPRYFYGGYAISQTGGHGDLRPPEQGMPVCTCGAEHSLIAVLADGVDECIKAVREELRKGAHHIKIMGSGGVMSPGDPVDRMQFSDAEITAIVEEAERHGVYVAAHCHPDEAVLRCARLGVRTIEHGTLTSEATATELVRLGTYVVPTLSVMGAIMEDGRAMGIPRRNIEKLRMLYGDTMTCLEAMKNAGVKLAFGTDLLAEQHTRQGTEFTMRGELFSPVEILRQATSTAAEVVRMEREIGCIREGAYADVLVVDGDPTRDIGLLASDGADLSVIMRDGRFVKRRL